MKRLAFLTAVFVFLAANISAQDLRKRALENPLDCALYLLSKNKNSIDADNLAFTFFRVERYDDALQAIDFNDNDYSRFVNLSNFGKQLIEKNKKAEAVKFLAKASSVLRNEEDWSASGDLPFFVSSLVEMNLSDEAFVIIERQDNEVKGKIFLSLAQTYLKLNQKQNAVKALEQAFELHKAFDDRYFSRMIALFYIKLQENEKALSVLKQIEDEILQSGENFGFLQLIPLYLQLGEKEKAESIWQAYGNSNDLDDVFSYASYLVDAGNIEKARPYLLRLQSSEEYRTPYGKGLVEIYLEINEVETALDVAKTISVENDNYNQQAALMLVADRFIADGRTDAALEVLDFAYQRARKVGEEHRGENSVGASPLTRKIIYLHQIRERYFNLNRFDTGLAVINSIKRRDYHFQEFYARSLVEYVKRQIKTLPRKTIYKLLDNAQNIYDEDEDFHRMETRVEVAEIYSKMDEKTKAVELLAKVLEEAKESCCYEDDFLFAAGKVFEQNKLKADTMMKKVLKEFIADAE